MSQVKLLICNNFINSKSIYFDVKQFYQIDLQQDINQKHEITSFLFPKAKYRVNSMIESYYFLS